jgi:hypothetical protein
MSIREIQPDQWRTFFDDFSRTHRGWPVIIEVLGPDLGDQIEARALPFEGIFAERRNGADAIRIMAGYKPSDHISHVVGNPSRIWLSSLADDDAEVVEIECTDQQKALIRFSTAGMLR